MLDFSPNNHPYIVNGVVGIQLACVSLHSLSPLIDYHFRLSAFMRLLRLQKQTPIQLTIVVVV